MKLKLLFMVLILPIISFGQTQSVTMQFRAPNIPIDSTLDVMTFGTVPARPWGITRLFTGPYISRYFLKKSDSTRFVKYKDSTIVFATPYSITHSISDYYGNKTIHGDLTVTGSVTSPTLNGNLVTGGSNHLTLLGADILSTYGNAINFTSGNLNYRSTQHTFYDLSGNLYLTLGNGSDGPISSAPHLEVTKKPALPHDVENKRSVDSLFSLLPGGGIGGAYSKAQTDSIAALKVPTSRQLINGYGISGGGTLATDRTITVDTTAIKSKASALTDYNNLSARISVGANPSASLGLTAINGSSTSFMRADAAPALSVAIAPTWTGVHRFSPSVTASSGLARGSYFTPTLTASANNDQLVSMDFGATYTPGAFTGTQSLDIRSAIGIATDRSNGAYYFSVGSSGVRGKISSNTSNDLIFSVQGTEIFRILGANGHFNIGGGAIDKGFLFLPAGSSGSTALNIATWTAPHSTATSGDIGNDGTNLHYTDASLNDRKLANLESPTFTGNAGFTNINSGKLGNLITANTPTGASTDSIVVKNAATLKLGAVPVSNFLLTNATRTTNKLFGTGSGTTFAEITLGTNISFSGTTLNATSSTDNILSKTADYTIVSGDFVAGKKTTLDLYVDATAGNVTITMPSAATFAGYTIYVTKTDASVNIVTINTVLGSNTLITQYQERQFNSSSSAWYNH